MKNIFLLLMIIISVQAFGQDPPGYQHRTVRERIQGSFMVDSTQSIPRYCGTPSGVRGGGTVQDGAIAIDTCNHVFFFYSESKWRNAGSFSFETKLINGGIVTWDSLLIFAVSPSIYQINGAFYTTTETHVTLDPAHASLPRIDLIYLDSTGVHKVTGDASATPSEPNLPPNSIRLTVVQVDATVTSPNAVDTLIIYDENVEWVGAATSVTTNFAGVAGVCHFVKTTDLGAVSSASYIQYTATSPIKISKYTVLKFNLSLKAAFANGTQLQLSWRRAGVLKSTTINIASGNYGYLRSAVGCQNITIPLSAWSFLSDSIDQIRIQFTGSNSSGAYIDWVQLQEGVSQPSQPGVGQRFGVSGEDAIATQNRYFNMKDQFFYQLDSVPSLVFTARDTRFKNLAGRDWMSYTTAGDSILMRRASYAGNIHGLFYPYSLVDKSYVDSLAGGGTPTLQQVLDAGSTLGSTETIQAGTNLLIVNGSSGGLYAASSSGSAIQASSPSNYAIYAETSYSSGLFQGISAQATNNDVVPMFDLRRSSTGGGGAAGNGQSIDLWNSSSTGAGSVFLANRVISKATTATAGSEVSQLFITGINSGVVDSLMFLDGNRGVTLTGLAGTGSRAVLADANGLLSAPISDISVKRNINSLDYGVDKIMQLSPVSFFYKKGWENFGEGKQIGFIAQDIQKVLPNSTFITPRTGKMGYNETDIIPILVKAVQEQQAQIEQLKREINILKKSHK